MTGDRPNAYETVVRSNPVPADRPTLDTDWDQFRDRLGHLRAPGRPHRRRWFIGVTTLLVLVGSGTAVAAGGLPRLPGLPAGDERRAESAATLVADYDKAHPGAGFAAVSIEPDHRSVLVAWHGDVPPDLRATLAGTGVPTDYVTAQYDQAELVAATAVLLSAEAKQRFAELGITADGFGPLSDRSGIRFEYLVTSGPVSEQTVTDEVEKLVHVNVVATRRTEGAKPA